MRHLSPFRTTALLLLCLAPLRAAAEGRWSGPYVGGSAGLAWGRSEAHTRTEFKTGGYFFLADVNQINALDSAKLRTVGPAAALHGGYGWQRDNWVLGIEAEAGGMRLRDARELDTRYGTSPSTTFRIRTEMKTDWLALLRLRGGYARGPWLAFLSGGATLTQVRAEALFEDDFTDTSGPSDARVRLRRSLLRLGWTAGAGLERALSEDWSVRVEGLHMELGRVTANAVVGSNPAYGPGNPFSHKADLRATIARAGVSRRFGR